MVNRVMDRAVVNGTALAFEVRGSGEPLVLVHGGLVADALAPLLDAPALAERYQLVAYHRRGNGESDHAGGPASMDQQAEDLLALLDYLGISRAHLAGYSFGGGIALQLAATVPERTQSLVLLEPLLPFVPLDAAAQEYFLGAIGRSFGVYGTGDKQAAIDEFAAAAFGPGYRTILERALPGSFAQAVADADTVFGGELTAMQAWDTGWFSAERIRQPLLSVYHDDPRWSGFRATHEFLAVRLPQVETAMVPAGSHLLQIETPAEVAAAMAGFLARQSMG